MGNWTDIHRNLRNHGDFVGRRQAEQDAYFEFFSGSETTLGKSLANAMSRALDGFIFVAKIADLPRVRSGLTYKNTVNQN